MLVDNMLTAPAAPPDLAVVLERAIDQRTWGRLRGLRIDVNLDRVLISGFAPSYYLKQLAWVAVQEAAVPGLRVVMNIQVTAGVGQAAEGRDVAAAPR